SPACLAMGVQHGLQARWPADVGLTASVMRTGRPVLIPDMENDARARARTRGLSGSVIAAPLVVRGQAIGMLRVSGLSPGQFSESDEQLVESLALATGIAVENARLTAEARQHIAELEASQRELRALADIG